MDKLNVFKNVLNEFETEELRNYCEDMILEMPNYVFTMPSSTSFKYHNRTQCQPGGALYHILMVTTVMNYILNLEYIKNKFPKPKQRDCLRIAAILHDSQKTEGGQYTTHTHPLAAQKWIEETQVEHNIKDELKKYIGRLVSVHSGEFTTSNRSKVILPKPETDDEFLVHLCDIIGSRSNLDMIYSQEQIDAVEQFIDRTPPDPDKYTFPFGKYKGQTFSEVLNKDKDYLIWMRDKADMELRDPLKKLLEEM